MNGESCEINGNFGKKYDRSTFTNTVPRDLKHTTTVQSAFTSPVSNSKNCTGFFLKHLFTASRELDEGRKNRLKLSNNYGGVWKDILPISCTPYPCSI